MSQQLTSPQEKNGQHPHVHRLGPLVPLLLGLYALVTAYRLSLGEPSQPGPGLWPFLVSVLLVGTSAFLVVKDDPTEYEPWTRGTLGIIGGLVSLGIFILLFQAIGFLIPGVLMLLVWLRLFAREPWKWAVPLALGGAVGLYLVFDRALGVPFPDGVLVEMIGL